MPPQKYCRSGPFFAAAAALNAGTRPFVVSRTVLIVTFGCFLWYSAIVSASQAFAPAASCSPHHHIVRFTGPVGNALGVAPSADAEPRAAVATPTARAATTAAASNAPLASRRPVIDAPFVRPPTSRPSEITAPAHGRREPRTRPPSPAPPALRARLRRARNTRARMRRPSPLRAPSPTPARCAAPHASRTRGRAPSGAGSRARRARARRGLPRPHRAAPRRGSAPAGPRR